jgi:hypothetical protein
MLTSATRLAHPVQGAKLSLAVDASATHIGACLQQKRAGSPGWESLGFFSKKLEPAQVKCSAFDRELLACFMGIRHFQIMLEGRPSPSTQTTSRSPPPSTALQTPGRPGSAISLLTWRSIPLIIAT